MSIDAICSPAHYAGPGVTRDKLAKIANEFASILGSDKLFVRLQGSEHFITRNCDDTLLYPRSHLLSGQTRYLWHDRGDGVFYGTEKSNETTQ